MGEFQLRKVLRKVLYIVLILSISLALLVTAIENNAYNKSYYLEQFERNNTVGVTGKSLTQLDIIADSLIDYLKGRGKDELLTPHFNEKEVLHMRDVQDLFDLARLLKYASMVIAILILIYIAIRINKETLGKVLFFGLFANHILVLIIGFLMASDFTKYWTIFHHIFFTNNLWLLDPKTDIMIQMLPEQFFSGMVFNIVVSFFVFLSIIQLVGIYYMKRGRRNEERKKGNLSGK
ncbi:TIGR01906 family membrane protein [Tissierella creatinini]|nr:TIGR01906 family membrane protein [Tissierella creatinini]TJX64445.1 TIGR01906 family membrane protein [Soehngenia saccharolytica]